MKKLLPVLIAVFAAAGAVGTAAAQELVPIDRTPIYRRSFTARYEHIGGGPVREAALSPDGSRVGFVRDNDLFIQDLSTGIQTRVTTDGERNKIINGATDWVYEEEYAFTRAWEWSPDSRKIAFLRFDESNVPEFSMMRYDGKLYPEPYTFKYPKAGEKNSVVSLHVYDIEKGTMQQVDHSYDAARNFRPLDPQAHLRKVYVERTMFSSGYIPRIGWTPSGDLFYYSVSRMQNHFQVVLAEVDDLPNINHRLIYDETSPTYIERPDENTVTFLDDGGRNADGGLFIVKNETKTGWMHLYLYSIKKGFLGAITSGEWEVTALNGVDGNVVSYTSTEPSPLSRADYTVKLNGKDKKLISVQTALSGDDIREFFTVPIEGGIELNGWMIKPEGFDPERAEKYPVFMTQYSGPGSQSVSYRPLGRGGDMTIYQPLLEAGYIIACVDPRGTGFRGEGFKKATYGNLGALETEDQIAAARWLAALPYVDGARIGIYGWSYGGFTSLNCILKGADVFKAAVAVAPVTSWRYYDTIYTEIYNGLPQDNPAGYDENSPINYADLLRGKLLLVHGTGDDNVHLQNSMEMAKALVAANKQFDMMTYTDDNHSMWPSGSTHVRRKIVEWVIANL